jgi:sialate O-acetylesterase
MNAVKFTGTEATVTFDHIGGGLCTRDEKAPNWFEMAGADGTFRKATAKIEGNSVVVSCKGLVAPKTVRFGWNGTASPNLINKEGLPARPFGPTSAADAEDRE